MRDPQADLPTRERRRDGDGEVLVWRRGAVRCVLWVEWPAVHDVPEDLADVPRSTAVAAREEADADADFYYRHYPMMYMHE